MVQIPNTWGGLEPRAPREGCPGNEAKGGGKGVSPLARGKQWPGPAGREAGRAQRALSLQGSGEVSRALRFKCQCPGGLAGREGGEAMGPNGGPHQEMTHSGTIPLSLLLTPAPQDGGAVRGICGMGGGGFFPNKQINRAKQQRALVK